MASGKVHSAASSRAIVLGGVGLVVLTVVCGEPMIVPAILAEVGLVCGRVVDPDADMLQITDAERRKIEARPWVGRLWLAWWAPYGAFFTHRGLSHWPILGTLTRAVWMPGSILSLLVLLSSGIIAQALVWQSVGALLAGWVMQDMVHLHLDGYKIIAKI